MNAPDDGPPNDSYAAARWLTWRHEALQRVVSQFEVMGEDDPLVQVGSFEDLVELIAEAFPGLPVWQDYARRNRPPEAPPDGDEEAYQQWVGAGPDPDEFAPGLAALLTMSPGEVVLARLVGMLSRRSRVPFKVEDLSSLDAGGFAVLWDWCRIPGMGDTWTGPLVAHRAPVVCVLPVRRRGWAARVGEVLLKIQSRPGGEAPALFEALAWKVGPGEDPEGTVRRKLEEDAWHQAGQLVRLNPNPWQVSPGFGLTYVYVTYDPAGDAYDITADGEPPNPRPGSEDVPITYDWVHLYRALEMVMTGRITDMKTVAALLTLTIDLNSTREEE